MKKWWIIGGLLLIAIGIAGIATGGWKTNEKLPEFEKSWRFQASELKNLEIKSDYKVNLKFVKSTDGTNSVSVKGQAPEKTIQTVQDAVIDNKSLLVDLRQKPVKYFNFLDFSFVGVKEEITVSLTDDAALDALKVNVDSGSIALTDVSAKTVDLSADSGNLTLNNLTADSLSIDVDSGKITGDGVRTKTLTLSADSGLVNLKRVTGKVDMIIDSGSVKLYKEDTSDTVIKADSGSVYVQVPASFAGYYDLKADSGSVHAPESKRETKDIVKVRADSGLIRVEQAGQ
ncbi:DUF4097 domain-containing protein [Cohnella faecalis]|uniref:DUF4097 domain-containing protein n=1 Tax=Cohnella faecalis TaxID=2315694 RepID=A0A398CL16_9BACL|nr:DUF4097 family beta strand repeat-containing protein [Cohnella faecalis]RIE01929.1 hypothetical protein D3H35_14235 [Cohnella faecalis]